MLNILVFLPILDRKNFANSSLDILIKRKLCKAKNFVGIPPVQCNQVSHRMLSLSWTLEYLPCTYQSRLVLCGRLNPAEHCQVLNLCRRRADLIVYELTATRDLQRVHLLWSGDAQSNFTVAYLMCSRVSGHSLLNLRVGFVPYSTTKKIQPIL